MNTSRRDLLKFFAAGTVITPAAGGALAQLIESPKARIITPETGIVAPFIPNHIVGADIAFHMKDGSIRRWESESTVMTENDYGNDLAIDPYICVQVRRKQHGSPKWTDILFSMDSHGKLRNRSAIVELERGRK